MQPPVSDLRDSSIPETASAVATVDLGAITHNYHNLKNRLKPGCELAPVVKANAYGLGMLPIATTLHKVGAKRLFVATIEEALQLRQLGPKDITIHTLSGLWPSCFHVAAENNITPVLSSVSDITAWRDHSAKLEKKSPYWIQVDTGLKRLGVSLGEYKHLLEEATTHKPNGIISHLASAYQQDSTYNQVQLKRFQQLCADLPKGILRSFSNSGGIQFGHAFDYDVVRLGRFLYGSALGATPEIATTIKPALNLKARILQIQSVRKSETIGYDQTFRAKQDMTVATLAIGYGDGYFQSLSNKGFIKIGTHKAPIVGRVSMDLLTTDVTKIPQAVLEKETWGTLCDHEITVDVLADLAGISPWETLTHLGKRLFFRYVNGQAHA